MPLPTSAADYTRKVAMQKDILFALQPTNIVNPDQTKYNPGMGLYRTAGQSIIQRPSSQFSALRAGCRVCADVHSTLKIPAVHYPA
jgi:hypothetical protein